jgi:hypothetical protein
MSTESVSSDSSIQAAQLVEDQLSEDELETVVGGAAQGNSCIKPPCLGDRPPRVLGTAPR